MSLWGAAGVGTRGRRQSELREEVPLRLLRRTALTRIVDEQQGMEPISHFGPSWCHQIVVSDYLNVVCCLLLVGLN